MAHEIFRGVFTPRSDIPPEAEKNLDGTCSYAESAAHERAKGRYNVSGRARDTHTLRGGGALAGPAPLHTFKQTERCIHPTEQAFPLRHRGGSYKQRRSVLAKHLALLRFDELILDQARARARGKFWRLVSVQIFHPPFTQEIRYFSEVQNIR